MTDPWLAALAFVGMLAAYPLMGLFIEARRVPAIIVTLGLSFVWLGLAALRLPRAGGSAPDWLVELLRVKPLIPLPVLLCVLPAAAAYLVLMVWRYGAVLRGYGASPAAIEAAGWSTRLAKAALYGFAGLFAFLAGILVTASTRGGDPTGSTSMTLLSVAAVILGGAAFSGGVVAPIGALFGTLTLVLVGTLLSLLGVNAVFLPMVQGLLLLGTIGVRTLLIGRARMIAATLVLAGAGEPAAARLRLRALRPVPLRHRHRQPRRGVVPGVGRHRPDVPDRQRRGRHRPVDPLRDELLRLPGGAAGLRRPPVDPAGDPRGRRLRRASSGSSMASW